MIHIYSKSIRLITHIRTIPTTNSLNISFHVIPPNPPEAHHNSIIITSLLPKSFNPSAKFILCTNSPQSLTSDQLNLIYELWPFPLTPSLTTYFFHKLQLRLHHEQHSSAEHINHHKRLLEMARQDYLTGLANRWYLQDFIEHHISEPYITCIYFDLDHFKQVNDQYGHQMGDHALAATAEMMQNEFADGFCARLGGDEFMTVLLGKRDIEGVEWRVNGFMKRLLRYYHDVPELGALSVSAGISQSLPDRPKTIDMLIHESDKALYAAKNAGRARCKVYTKEMG